MRISLSGMPAKQPRISPSSANTTFAHPEIAVVPAPEGEDETRGFRPSARYAVFASVNTANAASDRSKPHDRPCGSWYGSRGRSKSCDPNRPNPRRASPISSRRCPVRVSSRIHCPNDSHRFPPPSTKLPIQCRSEARAFSLLGWRLRMPLVGGKPVHIALEAANENTNRITFRRLVHRTALCLDSGQQPTNDLPNKSMTLSGMVPNTGKM